MGNGISLPKFVEVPIPKTSLNQLWIPEFETLKETRMTRLASAAQTSNALKLSNATNLVITNKRRVLSKWFKIFVEQKESDKSDLENEMQVASFSMNSEWELSKAHINWWLSWKYNEDK